MSDPITTSVGGATVTINPDTPAAPLAPRSTTTTVTDATGRAIGLTKPGVLAQFQLIEALGDTAQNRLYLAMCSPLIFVSSIDGAPVTTPGTKAEVEALIMRLDEAGMTAISKGVQEHFGENLSEDGTKNG